MRRLSRIALADARTKGDDAKKLLAQGTAPSIQKKPDQIDANIKARMTFKEVADECYESLVDRERAPATLRKALRSLRTSGQGVPRSP